MSRRSRSCRSRSCRSRKPPLEELLLEELLLEDEPPLEELLLELPLPPITLYRRGPAVIVTFVYTALPSWTAGMLTSPLAASYRSRTASGMPPARPTTFASVISNTTSV